MKLYYSPGACSFSPHVALREAGLSFDLVLADTKTKKLPDGTDYWAINPKGYVPMLELDDGERLTEGPVIVQYIADLVPEKKLAPPAGTMARYRLAEWLNYVTAEIHKTYSPLFRPTTPDEYKAQCHERLALRYKLVDDALAERPYLLGEFSVVDPYLFIVTSWAKPLKVDLSAFHHVAAFMERVAARPSVQAARAAEKQHTSK